MNFHKKTVKSLVKKEMKFMHLTSGDQLQCQSWEFSPFMERDLSRTHYVSVIYVSPHTIHYSVNFDM